MKKYMMALLMAVLLLLSACAEKVVLESGDGGRAEPSPDAGVSDPVEDPDLEFEPEPEPNTPR